MKRLLLLLVSMSALAFAPAQEAPSLHVRLDPVIIRDFPGIQSYTWAQADNKILIIGGTHDGLHRRQPFASFLAKYNNTDLIVLDLAAGKSWKRSLNGLAPSIMEQLQSSNMQFWQEGNNLVLVGGYGYSETRKDHTTHPALAVVRVKETIAAIVAGKEVAPFIQQLTDDRMAVTGGKLLKLGDRYYICAGQRFEGRYNPHGPDHGPGFKQEYTDQVRSFRLEANGGSPKIGDYKAITDTNLFHRRDLNALLQLNDKQEKMITVFSGVFQKQQDVPYTNLVDIRSDGYGEVRDFNQRFSHYHCASLPLYSGKARTMFTLFFGGIASKYIDTTGTVITDNDAPFVKTISLVQRKENNVKEFALSETMPGYFGASAEFIPAGQHLYNPDGILDYDKLNGQPQRVGYIIGGIDSRAPHVFWNNDPERSRASPVIWEVYLSKE